MKNKFVIATVICTCIFLITGIISVCQAPEIPDDVYDLVMTDKEAYWERLEQIEAGAPTLYRVASPIQSICSIVGIILSIVSIVKLTKAKEKGKIIPVACLLVIFCFNIWSSLSMFDMGKAMEAGYNSTASNNQ